jgi:LPXTG-site transpeptidase (sortase) family protein
MPKGALLALLNIIIVSGIFLLIALPMALILPGIPEIWYQVDASAVDKEVESIMADLGSTPQQLAAQPKEFVVSTKPKFDPSLPKENRVRIRAVGVDGQIYEGSDGEKVLAKGIWRVNNYGTPDNDDLVPTILASHRYGNPRWSNEFRDKEIFYNLDKVKAGDEVEVVWNQRLYRYKVTLMEVGRQVRQHEFDLMLYTCNYWNSPDRIFVYLSKF